MTEGILIGVVAGLIVTGIVGVVGWLRKEDNRKRLRRATCRHDWFSPNDEFNEPGSSVVFLSPVSEECRKCGATR
jgi:hypothetical protein